MNRPPIVQEIYEHRIRLGLSIRQAAANAGISEGSWRRTESDRRLKRTDETIARMAGAVGITPGRLDQAGWPAAARILRTLMEPAAPVTREPTTAELKAQLDNMERNIEVLLRRIRGRESEEDGDEPNGHNGSRRAG